MIRINERHIKVYSSIIENNIDSSFLLYVCVCVHAAWGPACGLFWGRERAPNS